MMRATSAVLGAASLGILWLGPLPSLARESFAAHMTMHMGVVAIAAPLVAVALAGSRYDPVLRLTWLGAPIAASMVELIVVWGWHAPVLHQAARHGSSALALEQISFLAAGLLLWTAVLGGDREERRRRAASGVVALLLTSMHMTLLGALFALSNRPLFPHTDDDAGTGALSDQHLGGAIMLLLGGAAYLAGGLWLTAQMLQIGRSGTLTRRESFP
jgi:putative membrane protein